jgi:sulfide dehydrogenase cytochrome subunit
MHSKKILLNCLGVALAAAATQVVCAEPSAGRLLAAQCAQCHGTNGAGGFEAIAGQNPASLYEELLEMKARPVENIMDRQARGYTDAQLWLIAEYLATLPSSDD